MWLFVMSAKYLTGFILSSGNGESIDANNMKTVIADLIDIQNKLK